MVSKLTRLFWFRIPFGGLIGIRLSEWRFLGLLYFNCGFGGDRWCPPVNKGSWRFNSIGAVVLPCRP